MKYDKLRDIIGAIKTQGDKIMLPTMKIGDIEVSRLILGAGRRCGSQEQVRDAFMEASGSMKPGDGVLVGMFDKYADRVNLNAQYTLDAIKAAEESKFKGE